MNSGMTNFTNKLLSLKINFRIVTGILSIAIIVLAIYTYSLYKNVNNLQNQLKNEQAFSSSVQEQLRTVNKSIRYPSPKPTLRDTSSWNDYTNVNIGFQLKYPRQYGLVQLPGANIGVTANGNETRGTIGFGSYELNFFPFKGNLEELINKRKQNDAIHSKDIGVVYPDLPKKLITGLSIDNQPAEWYENFPLANEIIFVDKGYGFLLRRNSGVTADISEFITIFSTFTFTEQPQINMSNWKTYTDSQSGFSLSYPPTAKEGTRDDDPFPVARQFQYIQSEGGHGLTNPGWLLIISKTLPNTQNLSLREWATANKIAPGDVAIKNNLSTAISDTTIGGLPAISWNTSVEGYITQYLVKRNTGITSIGINITSAQDKQTVNQVLFTLKFTN